MIFVDPPYDIQEHVLDRAYRLSKIGALGRGWGGREGNLGVRSVPFLFKTKTGGNKGLLLVLGGGLTSKSAPKAREPQLALQCPP